MLNEQYTSEMNIYIRVFLVVQESMFFSSEFEGGRHQARLEKFNHVESIK